ncbi:MAG: hypothetical protein M1836_006628 [Candelina mexicana]|nr:MAG: hypothetical protein M1836_006628 [Candelina mexicana]
MAIYPLVPTPNQSQSLAVDIESWTEQATQALHAVSISSPSASSAVNGRGPSSLAIPLDDDEVRQNLSQHGPQSAKVADRPVSSGYAKRREPIRRDSMKRREALLKGKEGSRRRQRWENDRLLNNPYAQPPLPIDWEVHPTYPRHSVPYYLAPLWDAGLKQNSAANSKEHRRAEKNDDASVKVPKQLREKLKRARGAKGLLRDLEEEVRLFVQKWEAKEDQVEQGHSSEIDSEDEEIVFVGRNGQIEDPPPRKRLDQQLQKDKLVFDSLANDQGASFGRWLVHSIASYYGLRTWSVTVGDPARREAYVGIQEQRRKTSRRPSAAMDELPLPLWGMV